MSTLTDRPHDPWFGVRLSIRGGAASLFVGPEAFGDQNFLATQMGYSPDGSQSAIDVSDDADLKRDSAESARELARTYLSSTIGLTAGDNAWSPKMK